MNDGEVDVGNVEEKSLDSSVPEYSPLSPLRESGSESGKDENSSEGEKDSENGEHDVDNANSEESENVEITDNENDEVNSDGDVAGKEDKRSVHDKECVKGSDSHSGIEGNMSESEEQSANNEHDLDNANNADSENVKITDKQNAEVISDTDLRENTSGRAIDNNASVKGGDSEGTVHDDKMTIASQDQSDVVEVSSETVDSKVIGEITRIEPDSDIENHSDTSADESEVEQISHSRTLTDSDKEDGGQHECKKKLTKVRVKLEPQDSSYEMVNVWIKNEDDESNSMSSMSMSYGETKQEEDVKDTEWYRVCTQSQGGHERGM